MKIKTRYKYSYGTPENFRSGNTDDVIFAESIEEMRRKIPNPGLVPRFVVVYQKTEIHYESEDEHDFGSMLSASDELITNNGLLMGENVYPTTIQIGYEKHFPKEMVADAFSSNEGKPNLDRILIDEIGNLPNPGRKDIGRTLMLIKGMSDKMEEDKKEKMSEEIELIRDLGMQTYEHLGQQRREYGLTSFEHGLYSVFKRLYGNKGVISRPEDLATNLLKSLLSRIVK